MKESWKKALYWVLICISIVNIISVIYFQILLRKLEVQVSKCFLINFDQLIAFQANQYSLLQIYLVLFSIILAMLAFFGFTTIKNSTEQAAKETAKEVAEKKGSEIYQRTIKMIEDYIGKTEKFQNLYSLLLL